MFEKKKKDKTVPTVRLDCFDSVRVCTVNSFYVPLRYYCLFCFFMKEAQNVEVVHLKSTSASSEETLGQLLWVWRVTWT